MTMIGYGLYYVLRENEEIVLPEYSKVPDKSIKTVLEEEKIKVEKPKKMANKRKKTTKEKTKKKYHKEEKAKTKEAGKMTDTEITHHCPENKTGTPTIINHSADRDRDQ